MCMSDHQIVTVKEGPKLGNKEDIPLDIGKQKSGNGDEKRQVSFDGESRILPSDIKQRHIE